jgi:hypothetical protein
MQSNRPIVTVVDYAELTALEERLRERRGPPSKEGYEIWNRYDDAVSEVLRRYGKIGCDADVDFYHGGDWFHELYNGFALMTTATLSVKALRELQEVVARHHPDAVLSFGGDLDTPMFGLDILITPTEIFAAWYESTADLCRSKLKKAGVQIL